MTESFPQNIRILEIGHRRYCSELLAAQTESVFSHPVYDLHLRASFRQLFRLMSTSYLKGFDLIVVYVEQWPPWHWKFLRYVFRGRILPILHYAILLVLLRFIRHKGPLAVIDLTEWGFIQRHNEFILDKCTIWFKRELPLDRWRVFRRSSAGGFPSIRFRNRPENRRRLERIVPLSLGCNLDMPDLAAFPEKTSDLFVCVDSKSTDRIEGLRQLNRLSREAGVRFDIVQGRLSREEFYRRMSNAWMTWSPHGYGWDCFRHYEAPMCYSVAVIPVPQITRQFPLVDQKHALYYWPDEEGSLPGTILKALEDREHLKQMAVASREYVMANLVWPNRMIALLLMALGRSRIPGTIDLVSEGVPVARSQ